jgi:hypothetical protein
MNLPLRINLAIREMPEAKARRAHLIMTKSQMEEWDCG